MDPKWSEIPVEDSGSSGKRVRAIESSIGKTGSLARNYIQYPSNDRMQLCDRVGLR